MTLIKDRSLELKQKQDEINVLYEEFRKEAASKEFLLRAELLGKGFSFRPTVIKECEKFSLEADSNDMMRHVTIVILFNGKIETTFYQVFPPERSRRQLETIDHILTETAKSKFLKKTFDSMEELISQELPNITGFLTTSEEILTVPVKV